MTNIWADLYKEIREPFFEMADPYAVTEEKKEKEEKGEKKHKEGKEEEESEKAGEDQEHKYTKKSGKKSKDYDGDGEVEDETDEYAGVKDRAIKKAMRKEERDLFSKSDKNDKIDVRKGLHNKIDTKPSIPEEVEAWVDELLEEGYDLSDFTWDEVVEIYETAELDEGMTMKDFKQQRSRQKQKEKRAAEKISPTRRAGIHADKASPERAARHRANVDPDFEGNDERNYPGGKLNPKKARKAKALGELGEADTTTMAPRGDAQTVNNTGADPLQAAKRRAAQAQVRKELSDLQVAKARASAKLAPASEEAILNYLENRYDLSEGVFDPKKTKLRSASERKSSELSPAQKKAAEMKQKRAERLESEAEKVLRQVRGGSAARRSSKPMGSEAPSAKAPAPEANRKLTGRQKSDTLAKKAGDVLKSLKK